MSYIGNTPAESFASFEKQVFTIVNSQTAYTLDHKVTNENDIRLVINNVVQEPGSGKAYTASGTTLTLSAALVNGTDEMYCVFLGRALQTVNPPNASVGSDQTAPTIITGQTAETSIATDDTILIHDTSASALRKMTRANFVSGIGGTNTPAFFVTRGSDQTISDVTTTTVQFDTEILDTDNCFDNSTNYRFTPTTAGKYYIFSGCMLNAQADSNLNVFEFYLTQNGTLVSQVTENYASNQGREIQSTLNFIVDMNGSSDYIDMKVYCDSVNNGDILIKGHSSPRARTFMGGYKLIGV
jgi:hypothetical protein